MKRLTLALGSLVVLLLVCTPTDASEGTVTVSANHTVYFAGHTLEELRALALDAGYNPYDDYWHDLDEGTASLPLTCVNLAGLFLI